MLLSVAAAVSGATVYFRKYTGRGLGTRKSDGRIFVNECDVNFKLVRIGFGNSSWLLPFLGISKPAGGNRS